METVQDTAQVCYPSTLRFTQEDYKELKVGLDCREKPSKNKNKYGEVEQSAPSNEGARVPDKVMSVILAS